MVWSVTISGNESRAVHRKPYPKSEPVIE